MWWNDCYVIGEYKYFHEFGSKLELILYWIRDYVAMFKKELLYLFILIN